MYFNKEKNNTNIDPEFEEKTILSNIIQLVNNYKFIIIAILVVIIISIIIILFPNKKLITYIDILGEENITIYQGTDYIEQGYKAYNSNGEDLTSEIDIKSTLNINEVGEYEITYSIGDVTKTRKVTVIAKKQEYTYIYLTPVNNDVNIYLKVGEKYNEPGYQVFNSEGKNLNSNVNITGSVDTSKKGNYKLIYSVTDDNNVTVTASRTVIVIDTDINLSLANNSYTNGNVKINVVVIDNYFDYIILPDNTKVTTNTYSYTVSENGKYTFTTYNKKGLKKQASIEVKNIDRTAPNGTCAIDINGTGSTIIISASDNSGIKKYIYNGKEYTSNKISLASFVENARITIYDKADNKKEITCKVTSSVYISDISNDGVIVTVKSTKINNNITGYYFSYTNQRPNKTTGGYISTSKESVDVVRLPGTTYVWVEDQYGNIKGPKKITLTNNVLFTTTGNGYKLLEGTSLSTYLSNKGWSLEGLNNLIARSVRAAGLYTKESAATSAVALETVLAQKYKIKLPYWWSGKSWKIGANSTWGTRKLKNGNGKTYYYYGLDCSGFTTWAYVNAGYKIGSGVYPAYFWSWWKSESLAFKKENGEVGDFITISKDSGNHIKLIVGKTDKAFITAEAKGKNEGMVISLHYYNKPNGYKIQKGELMMKAYSKIDASNYPSGF
ncbi:MAG: DUF5011 domain-containing protein [Bacilli bacterium]|nr:DUF5011 domain-containing protein [Bacilli bacterium]